MILANLNYPVTSLKGIGKNTSIILNKINIKTVGDLLEYFPRNFSDRTKINNLYEACKMDSATVKVTITDHRMIGKKYKKFLKVLIYDGTYHGSLVCFNRNFLKDIFIIGKDFYITGKFIFNYGEAQSTNFEYEEAAGEYAGRILPIYPLTEGLNQAVLRKSIEHALKKYRLDIENEMPESIIKKNNLLYKRDAVKNIHFPENFNEYAKAKHTFIFEEFFFQRLFLLKRKEKINKIKKQRPKINFDLKKQCLKDLPFTLMDYQQKALEEIEKSLFSGYVFSRLLQGDVGSGKTIIAFLAMLSVVECGYQAVLMAPTEILANQHYRNFKKFTKNLKLDMALFTGSLKKREKDNILNGLKSGELQIIIGTHSVFSENVIFKKPGLAVIDEQQRFGVEQRYQLLSKGEDVDLLLMTATPIPRSLALSLYGDLDLTAMKGSIKGRKPVKTWLIDDSKERIDKMHTWISSIIKQENSRAVFVYPLINESDKNTNKDLVTEFDNLSSVYKEYGAGFIHSKLDNNEKEKIMNDFESGKIKILAATTVVEVGIDVPDANIIVVENAHNYGLSTLHQLRGRVGRNNKQAYMILITNLDSLTDTGKKRLEVMINETDGFKIAEQDLMIRGPGDFLGQRQSGLPGYKFADIRKDLEIMKEACEDAELIYNQDTDFKKEEHINLRRSFLNRIKTYLSDFTAL